MSKIVQPAIPPARPAPRSKEAAKTTEAASWTRQEQAEFNRLVSVRQHAEAAEDGGSR
ncbi:hypothetical protein [Streptomyces sp. NPDC088739]|uniref:hypothetical protein n=1 Tax=Streptomyces sp. NPDC088739 TaxID=3365882 RepID=UPI0038219770